MKSLLQNLVMLMLVAILASFSCKSPPVVARADTVRINTVTVVPHDTTVYLTDSAGLSALLYCDSIGKVRIRQIQEYYAGQWIKPKIVIRDNYLTAICKIDSAAVVTRWNETNTTSTIGATTVQVKEVNFVTGFQWFNIWGFRILIIAGVLVGLFYTVKSSTWCAVLINTGSKLVMRLFKK